MGIFRKFVFISMGSFLLANCTQQADFDESSLSSIDLRATHAFEIQDDAQELAYIANDVAPWLGRIIIRTQAGALLSTDIEGRAFQSVAKSGFTHIVEVPRIGAPGIFLASTENASLVAFVESGNKGGFSQMLYSGEALTPIGFCANTPMAGKTMADNALLLTDNAQLITLGFSTQDNVIEQRIDKTIPAPADIFACVSGESHVYALSRKKAQTILHHYDGTNWRKHNAPPGTHALVVLNSGTDNALVLLLTETGLFIADGQDLQVLFKLNIIDGLSIRGLSQAQAMSATSANFGGGAFRDGFVGLLDADSSRVVFISAEYITRQISAQ